MPFDLKVTFSGTCLLVDDPSSDKLHALLPNPGSHGPGAENMHHARLIYRRGHSTMNGDPSGTDLVTRELANRSLDLSSVPSNAAHEGRMPPELFNLDMIMNRSGISKSLLTGDGEGKVHARVIVGPGGVTATNKGERWSVAGHPPRYMAISVTWTVPNVSGDRLDLSMHSLTGIDTPEDLVMHPLSIDGKSVVDLYVFHTPPSEIVSRLPPEQGSPPYEGQKALHFKSFYTFFPHPPVPVYETAGAAGAGSSGGSTEPTEANADGSSVHYSGGGNNSGGGTSNGDFTIMGLSPPCMSATATLES